MVLFLSVAYFVPFTFLIKEEKMLVETVSFFFPEESEEALVESFFEAMTFEEGFEEVMFLAAVIPEDTFDTTF